ncbi:MAG TPA: Sec-independent protein translocase protein TatB [Stellaceae bacterium]|nr:Sec-independent protein translocase protein TatB [Stellaceae bacterium]
MFDFAWSELALIAVVALVVIGPKDLPRVMRTVATWVRKARAVAHEFQGHVEQMVRDAELEEVRQEVAKATRFNLKDEIERAIDPKGELKSALDDPVLRNPMAEPPRLEPSPAPPAALEPPVPAVPDSSDAPQAPHEAPAASTRQSA